MLIVVLLLQLGIAPPLYEQLWDKGREQIKQAQYSQAVATLGAAIEEAERVNAGATSLAIATNDLAEVYRYLGDYSKAEPLYKRALTLLRTQQESVRQLVMVLNNQGTLYREEGAYLRAGASYKESLATAHKAHLEKDPVMGAILNGIAAVKSSSQGDLKGAEKYLKRSLQVRESILDPDSLELGETLNNLGFVWLQQKKYDKAEPALLRALRIFENQLGLEHPDLAVILSNLGRLYYERKQYDSAEKVLIRALEIRQTKLPVNHPSVAQSLFDLAGVMLKEDRSIEAQNLLQQAVNIRDKDTHALNVESVLTLQRYASVLRLNGHGADADLIDARAKSMQMELKYILKP